MLGKRLKSDATNTTPRHPRPFRPFTLSSLASSRPAPSAYLPSSSGHSRNLEDPLIFNDDYAAVTDWHNMHKNNGSTTIRKMQLRKEHVAPFHEFVIVLTQSDHTYRVDRGRDGPVLDTISKEGVPPCDTIALLPSTSLEQLDGASYSMIELRWGEDKTIDLLLVLNICFQIHTGSGRRYKLLTHNCYFFAQTIIMIAVRKTVASGIELAKVLKGAMSETTWKVCWATVLDAVGKGDALGNSLGNALGNALLSALGHTVSDTLAQQMDPQLDPLLLGWEVGWELGSGLGRQLGQELKEEGAWERKGRPTVVVRHWVLRRWAERWRWRRWFRRRREDVRPVEQEREGRERETRERERGILLARLMERRQEWEQEWEKEWEQTQKQTQEQTQLQGALAEALELAFNGEGEWEHEWELARKQGLVQKALAEVLELALSGELEPNWRTKRTDLAKTIPSNLLCMWWLIENLGKIVIEKVSLAPFFPGSFSRLFEFPVSFSVLSKIDSDTPEEPIKQYTDLEEYVKGIIKQYIEAVPPPMGSREELKEEILNGVKHTWRLVSS